MPGCHAFLWKHKTELASNPRLLGCSPALLTGCKGWRMPLRDGQCRVGLSCPRLSPVENRIEFPPHCNSQQPNDKTSVLNNFLSSFSRGAMELKIKQHWKAAASLLLWQKASCRVSAYESYCQELFPPSPAGEKLRSFPKQPSCRCLPFAKHRLMCCIKPGCMACSIAG